MSLEITSLLASTLENMVKKAVRDALRSCSERYAIDVEEECRLQGVSETRVSIKAMPKRSEGKRKVSKVEREGKVEREVLLPFNKEVSESKCQALCYNKGLYTQCQSSRVEGEYCNRCGSEEAKWGTVEERKSVGLYEYEGKCGRKPVAYLKVLEKLKISVEEAQEYARKQGITIDEEHLKKEPEKKNSKKAEKSSRGRPKKEAQAVEAEEVVDLFAQISASNGVEGEVENDVEVEKEVEVKKSKKLSDEERAAKKEALEAEKALQKQQREDALAAAKAEKDAAVKAEKEAKLAAVKAEKEAKLAAVKAEKEAKLAAVKAEKEAEKAKKDKKEAKKPESKAAKKDVTASNVSEVEKEKEKEVVVEKEEPVKPTKVTVTRIQIEGVEYMKSSANILYNPTTKEEVGIWDPVTQTIKELPEEEEEEEDYEDEEG